jgi:polyvinyl alcohol dehydrogenase (cytochrome)
MQNAKFKMQTMKNTSLISAVAAAAIFACTAFLGAQAPAAPPAQAPPAAAQGGGAGRGLPGTESGWATFQGTCFSCHTTRSLGKGPTANEIRGMTPERIYAGLTKPSHTTEAETGVQTLSDVQRRRVAEFMSGRPMGSIGAGEAKSMPNQCATNPAMTDPTRSAGWNGWGNDLGNTRFQPAAAARLTAADVPKLRVKWSFGFPKGETNNSQPTVVSGRVFVGGDNGYIYSLDAKTGCVYWSFQNGSIVRGSVTVGAVSGQGNARYGVFFGDGHANVFALDAQTGRQLWKVRVDEHVVARITAGLKYHEGRVYVPLSGSEEFNSGRPYYPCCTARGGVVALDASTGKQIWKTYNVDEPKPWKTNANGVQLYGPSAGGIWNSPTIDTVRGAVYVGTGDPVTPPESPLTDAVMALDLKTGKVLWSHRVVERDMFMGGCTGADRSQACPEPMGPDADIGNSPMLVSLAGGRRALFVGTKGGEVFALDPDKNGALLFKVSPAGLPTGGGRGRGPIVWGGAADARQVYYGMAAAGMGAVDASTGKTTFVFMAPGAGGRGTAGLGAAPTAIPGVVFQGAGDGRLFAVSTDGKQLWEFNTAQEFATNNKVAARGGAIATSGAVVVDGMVYVASGYAISSGASGGNVLLAFGVE